MTRKSYLRMAALLLGAVHPPALAAGHGGELRRILDRAAGVTRENVAANLDLARLAGERGLRGEERLFYLRVVAFSPEHDEANEALGHRRAGDGWLAPNRGRWGPVTRLDDLHADWNDAWGIETSHWRLRTNLPTAEAVETAIDLERFHVLFFEKFGHALGREDLDGVLSVDLHRNRDSFPERGSNRAAYLDESRNCVILHASGGLKRDLLFRETARQTLRAISGPRAALPPWLVEGLVEIAATVAAGRTGEEGFDPGRVDLGLFRAHARASRPLPLAEILGLRDSDFEASSRAPLRRAQAYTLVDFCLGETYRERFGPFVQEGLRGRTADFRREVADAGFEAAWREHVDALVDDG